jgi:hypothetical protein
MRHAARIIIAGLTTWATNPGHDAHDKLALEDMLAISVGTLLTYEGPGATIGELENRYPIPSEKIISYDQVNQSTVQVKSKSIQLGRGPVPPCGLAPMTNPSLCEVGRWVSTCPIPW